MLIGAYDNTPEGVAYTRYAEDNCRFVSEFGIQAAPRMATLKRWMAPEDLVLGSEGLFGRIKDKPEKANALMAPVTGEPTTLEEYVDFSMWTQAEGLKFGIERLDFVEPIPLSHGEERGFARLEPRTMFIPAEEAG